MARRDMDKPCSLLCGNVICGKHRNIMIIARICERMTRDCSFNLMPHKLMRCISIQNTAGRKHIITQLIGNTDNFTRNRKRPVSNSRHFKRAIGNVSAKSHSPVPRHGPRRCCPDNQAGTCKRFNRAGCNRKLGKDSHRRMIGIFDFGFCKSCLFNR